MCFDLALRYGASAGDTRGLLDSICQSGGEYLGGSAGESRAALHCYSGARRWYRGCRVEDIIDLIQHPVLLAVGGGQEFTTPLQLQGSPGS